MRLFLQHVKTYFLFSILLGFNVEYGMEMIALEAAKAATLAKTAVKTATEAAIATENQAIQNAAQQAVSQNIVRSTIKPVLEAGLRVTHDSENVSGHQPYLPTISHQYNQPSSPLQLRPSSLNPVEAHRRTQFNNQDNGIPRALATMRRLELEAAAKKAANPDLVNNQIIENINQLPPSSDRTFYIYGNQDNSNGDGYNITLDFLSSKSQYIDSSTQNVTKTALNFNEFVNISATESFIQEYNLSSNTLEQMGREITFDATKFQQAFKDAVELNRLNTIPEVKTATEAAAHLNLHGYCLTATGNKEMGALCLEGAKELNNYARCIANEHKALNHEGLNQAALYSKNASVHLIKAIAVYEKLAGLSLPPAPVTSIQLVESTLVDHIKTHVRAFNQLPFNQQNAQIDKTIPNLQGPGLSNDIARLKTIAINQHAHMLELRGNTAVSRDTAFPMLDIAGTLKSQAEHLAVVEQRLNITATAAHNADAVNIATIPGQALHTKIEPYKKLYAEYKQLGAEAGQKGDILYKQRCEARVVALEAIDASQTVIRTFSPSAQAFLSKNEIDISELSIMHGDSMQLHIHQELCDIIETTTDLAARNVLQEPQTDMLLTYAMVIDHANRFGNAGHALSLTDFCHGVLDCGRAIGSGVQSGIQNFGQNISKEPLVYAAETAGCVVVPVPTLGARLLYETTKLAANAHLEVINNLPPGTQLSDNPMVQQLLSQKPEASTQQTQPIAQQQFSTDTIPGCIEYATRVGTEIVGHGGITYGTGRAIHHLAQKPFVVRTLQRGREYAIAIRERVYPQTATAAAAAQPKAANALQTVSAQTSQAAQPKGITPNRAVQQAPLMQQQVAKKTKPGVNPNWGQPTKIRGWHKDTYTDKGAWGHVFSKQHMSEGILNLGKDKSEIFKKFMSIIQEVDKAGFLVEGDNEIRLLINGYEATIRPHIRDGIVMNFTGFAGYSGQVNGKLIQW